MPEFERRGGGHGRGKPGNSGGKKSYGKKPPRQGQSPRQGEGRPQGQSPRQGQGPRQGQSPRQGQGRPQGQSPRQGQSQRQGQGPRQGQSPRRDQSPRQGQASRQNPQAHRQPATAERSPAPELPEGAEYGALDAEAKRGLGSLPKGLAEAVGKHLVAAGMLVDTDPDRALKHAQYARAKAARVPLVREAVGVTAYHAGQWSLAIGELRAVRRMTGDNSHVAVIADCERALGRPERAIDLAREARGLQVPPSEAVELRIVAAGARRDLGQLDAAVVGLQGSDLSPERRDPWSARLFYAYADNLLAAGRTDEAVSWFLHADDADAEGETDAGERAVELAQGGDSAPGTP